METEPKEQGHKPHVFEIIVDRKHHNWPEQYITGLQLKRLAGVDPATYSVWMQVPGKDDPEIADNERVDLAKPGVEKFFTGKKQTTEG